MTKDEIVIGITDAFNNLYNWNSQVFDYWISELYDVNENEIWDKWNEDTLKLMETDVMYAIGELVDSDAELVG